MTNYYPKKQFIALALGFLTFNLAFSQVLPIMDPIQGPSVVCSQPANPKTYTASAINFPTSFAWSVIGPSSSGVVISNPSGSVTTISFPFPTSYTSYTVYCSASNGAGTSLNSSSMVVNVYETPKVTFSGANVFCQGSSTNLSASPTVLSASSTLSYSWSPSTGLSSTTGYSVHASPPSTTNYTILLTMGTCTNSAQVTVQVIQCVGISSFDSYIYNSMSVYPNPNSGDFTIKSDNDEIALIINELGQTLRKVDCIRATETKITSLPPGIYFIVTPNARKKMIVTQK
jgi:hypothetical protein